MGQIKVAKAPIDGLFVIEPTVHGDRRGYFMETYNLSDMQEAGLDMVFVQDNQSMSKKGVLRGLHFQKQYPQGKLVRVIKGSVFDVAVDLRRNSKTYGKWYGAVLSEENKKQFYISEGFAHGFLVLSDEAEFCYKVTDFYRFAEGNYAGILLCLSCQNAQEGRFTGAIASYNANAVIPGDGQVKITNIRHTVPALGQSLYLNGLFAQPGGNRLHFHRAVSLRCRLCR